LRRPASICFKGPNDVWVPRLDRGQFYFRRLRVRRPNDAELGGGDAHCCGAKKAAAMKVEIFARLDRLRWRKLLGSATNRGEPSEPIEQVKSA
jgi:hypothetical protein